MVRKSKKHPLSSSSVAGTTLLMKRSQRRMVRLFGDDRKATVTHNREHVVWSHESGFLLRRLLQFSISSMNPWSQPALCQQSRLLLLMFWWFLDTLNPINHCLNVTVYLSDHAHLSMTTVYHLLMATSCRIMLHVTKWKSSQIAFLNIRVLPSHQIWIQENTDFFVLIHHCDTAVSELTPGMWLAESVFINHHNPWSKFHLSQHVFALLHMLYISQNSRFLGDTHKQMCNYVVTDWFNFFPPSDDSPYMSFLLPLPG